MKTLAVAVGVLLIVASGAPRASADDLTVALPNLATEAPDPVPGRPRRKF